MDFSGLWLLCFVLWDAPLTMAKSVYKRTEGSELTIICSYHKNMTVNRRVFCRGDCGEDHLLVQTSGSGQTNGRYSIKHERKGSPPVDKISVSISNLTVSDSGRYRCVWDRPAQSTNAEFMVEITDGAKVVHHSPVLVNTAEASNRCRIIRELVKVVGLGAVVEVRGEELPLPAPLSLGVGQRDIIFLLDTTMGIPLFNATQWFIRRFVRSMPIGPNEVQVGVAQFSSSVQAKMDLNTHGSKDSLVAALGRLRPRSGQTINIGAALDFVRTEMLRPDKGSRLHQGVPQLVLLMTTKRSSDSVYEAARALQQMGVLTLAVGSKRADEEELKRIAFSDSVVFMVKDLRILLRNSRFIGDALSTLSRTVVRTEGPSGTEASPGPEISPGPQILMILIPIAVVLIAMTITLIICCRRHTVGRRRSGEAPNSENIYENSTTPCDEIYQDLRLENMEPTYSSLCRTGLNKD